MTFKSLMNFGNFGKSAVPPIDRYHSGSGGHHYSHGGHKSKGGGSGAALSALTLLAFLFLINVMQQSMQDSTSAPVAPTAILLRDGELPIILDERDEKDQKKRDETLRDGGHERTSKSPNAYVKLKDLQMKSN